MRGIVLAVALALVATPAFAQEECQGNCAPSGPHYNLNIQGKENCSGDDLVGSNRHTIQVELWGQSKIWLAPDTSPKPEFKVLDGNGCDTDGAKFQLPVDVSSTYVVFARALGSPKEIAAGVNPYADIRTCIVDELGVVWCDPDYLTLKRTKGKQIFENVSRDLLFIDLCLPLGDPECDLTQLELFSEELWEYYWEYNNKGLRLAQLRFYPMEQ